MKKRGIYMFSFKHWLKETSDFDSKLHGLIQGKTAQWMGDQKIGQNPSAIATKVQSDPEIKKAMFTAKSPLVLNPTALQQHIKKQVDDQRKETQRQQLAASRAAK